MNLRGVDLNLLTVFDAIFTEGNLTRAADRIGMSQPAMSNALNRLRHLTKDDLFVREGRGIRPTAAAVDLAPSVRQALSLIEEALSQTPAFDPVEERLFHIGGFDFYEVAILPALLDALKQKSPNVKVHASTGTSADLAKSLRYGEVDLVIDYVPLTDDEYKFELLFSETLVVMHRRNHPKIGGAMTLANYLDSDHVYRENRPDEPVPEIDQVLGAMGRKRNISLSLNNWLALPAVVANSDLVCSAPRIIAEFYAPQFDLVISPCPVDVRPVPVFMIWHSSKEHHVAHRWLRAQVKRVCRKL